MARRCFKKIKAKNVSRTALVTLTHDEKLDDPAMMPKNNFKLYRLFSSKRTHKKN